MSCGYETTSLLSTAHAFTDNQPTSIDLSFVFVHRIRLRTPGRRGPDEQAEGIPISRQPQLSVRLLPTPLGDLRPGERVRRPMRPGTVAGRIKRVKSPYSISEGNMHTR